MTGSVPVIWHGGDNPLASIVYSSRRALSGVTFVRGCVVTVSDIVLFVEYHRL